MTCLTRYCDVPGSWPLYGTRLLRMGLIRFVLVFQEPSGGGFEAVIKELVSDSLGGDSFTVEEAVVLLREKVAERDALKTENENLRRQLMDMVVDKAYMTRNDLLLRQELDDIRSGSEPSVLQLKQLLTEPAVNREFMRLSSLAKSASLEAAALREEIRAMHVRYLTEIMYIWY